tara:strand:- start:4682 stop:5656 length:975 start_codon:yes stop_codon:yes gene_type:complete
MSDLTKRLVKNKKALIFGISGQDGSYLAKYLIYKKYKVFGVSRIKKKIPNHKLLGINKKIQMLYLDYYNYEKIKKIILDNNISEIYYLAGQTKPSLSNGLFLETLYSNLVPVYYIMDVILKNNKEIRFFNASSCEIFKESKNFINEKSKKEPKNIYGLSKLISFEMVKFFREKYKLKICTGIMFHHESMLRDKDFVLRKLVNTVEQIKLNKQKHVKLGNINISRDWGWAPEYVTLFHKMINQKKMEDLIIATGVTVKLKFLIKKIFKYHDLNWIKHIKIENKLLRKFDTAIIKADNKKIKKKFKWSPVNTGEDIINNLLKNRLD